MKFKAGALAEVFTDSMSDFVDREFCAALYFGDDVNALAKALDTLNSDREIFAKMQAFLAPFSKPPSKQREVVESQLSLMKNNAEIMSVQQLAEQTHTSVRTLQRNFIKYLGLSPKWLLRKYRLHQVLSRLENDEVTIADLIVWLGYTDQSHLIRDFKEMLGITPKNYLNTEV